MSQLTNFISAFDDEESLGFDSAFRGGLNTLNEGFYSQGHIDFANVLTATFDRDYYTINLGVGSYTIAMTSDASRYGYTVFGESQSLQFDLTDFSGNVLLSSQQDFSKGSLFDDVLDFTSNSVGTFYVEVYDSFSFSGADYAIELISNTISAADIGENTSTTGRVVVGGSVNSDHTTSDFEDWFAVSLTAGTKYSFHNQGSDTGSGTMADPYLQLYDGSGVFINGDDDSGIGLNAQLTYTPTTTGTHYIASTSATINNFSTGTYTLSVTEGIQLPTTASGRAIVVANIASDAVNSPQMTWLPYPESSSHEYIAQSSGTFDAINVAHYVPVIFELGNQYDILLSMDVEPAIFINDGEGHSYIGLDGDDIGIPDRTDIPTDSVYNFTPDFTGLHYMNIGPATVEGLGVQTNYTLSIQEDINPDLPEFNLFGPQFDTENNSSSDVRASVDDDVLRFLGDGSEGSTTSVAINGHTDEDYIHVDLTAGQTYEVRISANTLTLLQKPYRGEATFEGRVINWDQDTDAVFTHTASNTGSHALLLKGAFSDSSDFGAGGVYRVSVSSTNTSPIAGNDGATVRAGQAVTINIGANDSDTDNDALTTTGLTNPTKGTVRYTDNSTTADIVIYTPFSNATGTDSFTYQVADGNGGTDTATVTVTITAADLAGDASTTGQINVGESIVGTHESGDFQDWYAVSLMGGRTYVIDLEGTSTGAGTLSDPILEVFENFPILTDFVSVSIGSDNNSGIGTNARLSLTPSNDRTYYLSSESALENNNALGTYKLTITQPNNNAVMTNPNAFLTANSSLDVLDINKVATQGALEVNLEIGKRDKPGISINQVPTFDGADSPGFRLFFENVLADGYIGGFGSTITGSSNDNIITSTPDADQVNGLGGNDIITGGGGDDNLIGEAGTDTAIFSGSKSQYTFRESGTTVIVSDSQVGRDGSDTLSSMENYEFSDGTFQLADLINPTDIDRGIYRFFNVDTGTHFLSGSTVERDSVINNLDSFNFEGPTFRAADPSNPAADTVFRFFNTQTGTHFFTQSTVERDNILDTIPQFNFEGEAYKGYTEQVDGSIPLYRFFNTQTGTHFYTAAEAEKDSIIENLPTFNFEGTAYWVDPVMG